MSALQQYLLLLGMVVATIGLVLSLYAASRSLSRTRAEKAKDVPATSGELSPEPAWVRYHARYYGYALLFLAFDMEMAYMYPWAVVFRDLGLFAYAEIGFFLSVLGIGILYAWREGALEWS